MAAKKCHVDTFFTHPCLPLFPFSCSRNFLSPSSFAKDVFWSIADFPFSFLHGHALPCWDKADSESIHFLGMGDQWLCLCPGQHPCSNDCDAYRLFCCLSVWRSALHIGVGAHKKREWIYRMISIPRRSTETPRKLAICNNLKK